MATVAFTLPGDNGNDKVEVEDPAFFCVSKVGRNPKMMGTAHLFFVPHVAIKRGGPPFLVAKKL